MFGFVKKLLRRDTPPDLDPVALVLLETEPRVLTRGHVAHAVSQAIGAPFGEGQVVEEAFSYHRLIVHGYELTIGSRPEPYIPKDRADPTEIRLYDVITKHEAAILVDCWDAPPGHERTEATDLMGRIVAALADETTLGVYCFHTQRLNAMEPKLAEMLGDGRAMEAMETQTSEAVVGVRVTDELMNAAIDEARARWPEFVAAFAARTEGDRFSVKARFGDDDLSEHMWFEPDAVDESGAAGVLRSQPYWLPRPRQGDRVAVSYTDVSDWLAAIGDERRGGFSDAAIRAVREASS